MVSKDNPLLSGINSFGASPAKQEPTKASNKPVSKPAQKEALVFHDNFLLPDVNAKKLTFDEIMTQETAYPTVQ